MIYNGAVDVPTVVTPVTLITRENIFETLIKGGVFTKEQIYGSEPISSGLK
jgi:D-xylose transport system substrate-binding protein